MYIGAQRIYESIPVENIPLNSLLVSISYDRSFESQMHLIRHYYDSFLENKKTIRPITQFSDKRKKIWIRYLRCFDAYNAKAKKKYAYNIIFPTHENSEEHWDTSLRKAKSMIEIGLYKILVSLFQYH